VAVDGLFDALLEDVRIHTPGTRVYTWLKASARQEIEQRFSSEAPVATEFGRFGNVCFPYNRMGAIDSLDLFGLDELIILLFYWSNRALYRRTVDIGANLGLHTIIMSRCGFHVTSFEPDPVHFELLRRNTALNNVNDVELRRAAVSSSAGKSMFVRVLGNTTGSHLAGAKNSYGEREEFEVTVEAAAPLFASADLVKLDAEGQEREIVLSTGANDWNGTDAMMEVGSEANARAIFDHLSTLGVNMFVQQKGWKLAERAEDIPTSHRQGSLFASRRPRMPWPGA
jgi:FkbM family methyltransferase